MPTVAAPISSGVDPHPFVSFTRTVSPAMLVRTICRTVWSSNRVEADGASTPGIES